MSALLPASCRNTLKTLTRLVGDLSCAERVAEKDLPSLTVGEAESRNDAVEADKAAADEESDASTEFASEFEAELTSEETISEGPELEDEMEQDAVSELNANNPDDVPAEGLLTKAPRTAMTPSAAPSAPPSTSLEPGSANSPVLWNEDKLCDKMKTIMIFDWDDTVLPTTWLKLQGLDLDKLSIPNEEQMAQLKTLAERGAETLEAAKRLGTVVLITNAERGWIELSCQKFMPSLLPSISDIRIVSARSAYEPMGIRSPTDWKFLAFESVIDQFCKCMPTGHRANIIQIGDSRHEREALIRATTYLGNCCAKSIKLIERPTLEQIAMEHDVIRNCFENIVDHDGNIDLCIGSPSS